MSQTIYSQTRWSLQDLFPGPQTDELETAFTRVSSLVEALEARRSELSEQISTETFLSIVKDLEVIIVLQQKIYTFAGLHFSEDTQNQVAQNLIARVDQFMAEIGNRILFFELWWKSMPDAKADMLIAASGDYAYWLEAVRHFIPHTLSEAEEKIVNIKNVTGVSALQMVYSSITNRYNFKLEVNGEMKEITRGELMMYVRQGDPDLRARAYQELYKVYGGDSTILGQIYQAVVRDWRNEQVSLRKHGAPISARNLINDIPDEVVDTLLDVCRKNAGVFQRYFKLKAKWLGLERLRRYDLYAPVAQSDKAYDFNQGTELVLDAFEKFDPRFAEMAKRVFDQNHLDSEVRKGKRGGAFCWPSGPDLTPWVMLNYQGKADDVSTMAHELGHAIHGMLAADHSIFTFHSNLPLAETASTFGEMVLVDYLLQHENDAAVRRDILFSQVDDAYATIMRQAFFALFEREAHEMINNNASVADLSEAYLKNLQEQFGDAVEISDEFRWEWISIPHIYDVPFYVYAYTFGQLLVLSLYQQYKAEGESFKPRYTKILSTGGSKAPVRVLSEAGINVYDPNFWQGGFDVLTNLVAQLEAIPVEK
ncbi:MAG: oligoendopeptidase F [Chloroflexi bacterium HGW-Chloroflexi-10]|nr:MAG: oligoendopeptidase F [Chloroflexi bacterium HGW-Chloroflexi-10]